jgi:hypothetical protein
MTTNNIDDWLNNWMTDLMTGGMTELTEWMTWLYMRKIEEET